MKFDLEKPLLDLDGNPMQRPSGNTTVVASMRFVVRDALTAATAQPLTPEQSIRRFDLNLKLAMDNPVDLDASDVVLIQQCLVQKYNPLVVGQVAAELKEPLGGGTGKAPQ